MAEVPQVDHRVRQGLERRVQLADAIEAIEQAPEFVLPDKRPFNGVEVLKCSSNIAATNIALRPRLGVFLRRGLALIFGTMPRLNIAFRFRR